MSQTTTIFYQEMPNPFGVTYLYANDEHLLALLFKPWTKISLNEVSKQTNPIIEKSKQQLQEYFSGVRKTFTLPIQAQGTEFQKTVWNKLMQIPYGQTWNYGQLAKAIGNKNASRAVGMANGKNPISIIVPCHRVIGANGTLTGYAGGLKAKQWLLEHEGSI